MPGIVKLKDKLCDVAKLEDYIKNPDVFIQGHVAIELEQSNYILPVINNNSEPTDIGIEVGNTISRVRLPVTEEDKKEYDRSRLVDFNKATNITELINMQETVIDMEKDILTNPDNISNYQITEEDTPAMRLLKEAVNAKHINLDSYDYRFGSNFNNDKRIFNKHNVSLAMMERMANALDMKLTLTLQDVSDDVANPIGKPMSIDVTGGNYECE